jgi:hypothetical protein
VIRNDKDETLTTRKPGMQYRCIRSSVFRWVWVGEQHNTITDRRTAPLQAYVVDDFGNLQQIKYISASLMGIGSGYAH